MKSYYEILEVSEKASKEIIEKAYKTLAKRYHPDLQEEANKKSAEEKMQKVNEAYELLIEDEKRSEYNSTLKIKRQQEFIFKVKQYNKEHNIGQILSNPSTDVERDFQDRANEYVEPEIRREENIKEQSYSISYKKRQRYEFNLKNLLALAITIAIIFIIAWLLWIIPPTRKWLLNIYNENYVIKEVIDMFIKIFSIKM